MLKDGIGAGENSANTAEARTRELSDEMSKIRAPIKGQNRTVGGEHVHIAGLVDAELVPIRLVISAALSERESTVSKAICHVRDGFPVQNSSDARSPSAGGYSDQA